MARERWNLTPTQQALYAALCKIRDLGVARTPEAEKTAIGGLSDGERWALRAVHVDGVHVSNVTMTITIPGVSVRTYNALANLGLVQCRFGMWGVPGDPSASPSPSPSPSSLTRPEVQRLLRAAADNVELAVGSGLVIDSDNVHLPSVVASLRRMADETGRGT